MKRILFIAVSNNIKKGINKADKPVLQYTKNFKIYFVTSVLRRWKPCGFNTVVKQPAFAYGFLTNSMEHRTP